MLFTLGSLFQGCDRQTSFSLFSSLLNTGLVSAISYRVRVPIGQVDAQETAIVLVQLKLSWDTATVPCSMKRINEAVPDVAKGPSKRPCKTNAAAVWQSELLHKTKQRQPGPAPSTLAFTSVERCGERQ